MDEEDVRFNGLLLVAFAFPLFFLLIAAATTGVIDLTALGFPPSLSEI